MYIHPLTLIPFLALSSTALVVLPATQVLKDDSHNIPAPEINPSSANDGLKGLAQSVEQSVERPVLRGQNSLFSPSSSSRYAGTRGYGELGSDYEEDDDEPRTESEDEEGEGEEVVSTRRRRRRPTARESALLARRILRSATEGVLSTVFPSPSSSSSSSSSSPKADDDDNAADDDPHVAFENRPSGLSGMPIGLPDYISDCESTGNPTILAISIATSFKNARAGSNVSVAISSHPDDNDKRGGEWESPAAHARFSLLGYIEAIPEEEVKAKAVEECFLKSHPDAKLWLPGNRIHESWWARVVVQEVYWVGGFGDRNYIGWIDAEDWRGAMD